jgi:hypothetical protein
MVEVGIASEAGSSSRAFMIPSWDSRYAVRMSSVAVVVRSTDSSRGTVKASEIDTVIGLIPGSALIRLMQHARYLDGPIVLLIVGAPGVSLRQSPSSQFSCFCFLKRENCSLNLRRNLLLSLARLSSKFKFKFKIMSKSRYP